MKKIVVLAMMSALSLGASAEVLTPAQALERVVGSAAPQSKTLRPQLVSTHPADGLPAVYVFTAHGDKGFMVISADDCAAPLLGICDDGHFDASLINPSMQEWLDGYADEIRWLRSNPNAPRYLPAPKMAARTDIAPMVTTRWSQDEPYNNMCPADGNQRTVTGCVATAMAQIVNYHKLPTGKGTGSASVTYKGTTYTFDYASESFDWANMLDDYTGSYTDAQANAVAKLMYACGVSVDMSYGTGASGAVTSNVATALPTYFGFDSGAKTYQRKFYTLDNWNDLVYQQLKDYGPVQFSGRNDEGGHSFVCDGYRQGDFFHINWGWGGASDGYFKLTALDPDSQGIGGSSAGYNSSQAFVGNICAPRGEHAATYSAYVGGTLGTSVESVELGTAFNLTGGFWNESSETVNMQFGYTLENTATGAVTEQRLYNFSDLKPNYGRNNLSITLPTTLAAGTYRLRPVWRLTGNTAWNEFRIGIADPQFVLVKVEGTTATLSTASAILSGTVESLDTPVFNGRKWTMQLQLANTSGGEFLGNIFGALFSSDGTEQLASAGNLMVDVLDGETIQATYSSQFTPLNSKTVTDGNYLFVLADEKGRIISPVYNLTIEAAPTEQGTVSVSNLTIKDANSVNAMALEMTADVKCTSGYFIGNLHAYIFPENGGSSSMRISSPTLYIPEGETQKATFKGAVDALKIGTRYMVVVFGDAGNQLTGPTYMTVGLSTGVESVAVDNAEVVGRELYDLSGRRIADGETPRAGIYIVRERRSDGTVTTTKQLVR